MKTKILFVSSLLSLGLSNAGLMTSIQDVQTAWQNNINQVQYIGGGDGKTNYGGFLITPSRDPIIPSKVLLIKDASDFTFYDKLECRGQLRGYFWSATRGNILFPLSQKDLENLQAIEKTRTTDANKIKYSDMKIQGGIFSDCNDQYLIDSGHNTLVGALKFFYKDFNTPNFSLYAGRQYDLTLNRVISEPSQVNGGKIKFVGNFQLKDNKMPIGFLYDSAFGIGFAGGVIDRGLSDGVPKLIDNLNHYDSHIDILNEIKKVEPGRIYLKDSSDGVYSGGGVVLTRGGPIEIIVNTILGVLTSAIKADGLVGLSNTNGINQGDIAKEIIKSQRLIIDGKTQSDIVTTLSKNYGISDIVNIAREKANNICRGKWIDPASNKVNISSEGTYCYDTNGNGTKFVVDQDLTQNSDTNIFIKGSVNNFLILEHNQIGANILNAFVDRGYLLLSNDIGLVNISPLGEISNGGYSYEGSYIRGNFVINGIMAGVNATGPKNYNSANMELTGYNHRLLIQGTLASFNTLGILKDTRKNTINSILGFVDGSSMMNQSNIYDRTPIRKVADSEGNIGADGANGALVWECVGMGSGTDFTDCKIPDAYKDQTLPATAWYIKADSTNKSILFD